MWTTTYLFIQRANWTHDGDSVGGTELKSSYPDIKHRVVSA